jgi:exosome complex RNA-binding protein Csl4
MLPAMQTMGQTEERPAPPQADRPDPGAVMRTCANCGSTIEERKCKLICQGCGYFLSCSDYY